MLHKMWSFKTIVIIITILLIASTISYATINSTNNINLDNISSKNESYADIDLFMASKLSREYEKTNKEVLELKEQLGDWNTVAVKLDEGRRIKFTNEKVQQLYENGYGVQDIENAERIAALYKRDPEEILAMKGKTTGGNPKTWNDILQQLDGISSKTIKIPKLSKEEIKNLEDAGFNDIEIYRIASISINYGKDCDSIVQEIKKGKTITELEERFDKENFSKKSKKEKEEILKEKSKIEADYIRSNGVKSSEVELCKQNGITEMNRIIFVKRLATKYQTTVDKILELKKSIGKWEDVVVELEVKNIEK